MSLKSAILAGLSDQKVWLRVEGRGTFQTSSGLKEYVRRMIQRGHRDFIIDLSQCELMDSTFMGTMAGIALRLREIGSGSLTVMNPNPRNFQLLENLGLDHLFQFARPGESVEAPRSEKEVRVDAEGAEEQRTTILSAHEALVEADPENEARFKDVLELLKQEAAQDPGDS
mgnify:CR=1 FL=1